MIPALIGAGAAIAGSAMGAASQRRANASNERLQREFAQNGIRWKVEDAKAAGLHPLFALGGSGATYTPSAQPVFDGAALGQNLSRAAQAFDPDARAVQVAQLKALEAASEKDFATAQAMRSEAARTMQGMLASIPPVAESFPIKDFEPRLTYSTDFGRTWQHEGTPRELPPSENLPDYITANIGTAFTRYKTPWGEMLLPSKDAAEALEALESMLGSSAVLAANAGRAGAKKFPKREWSWGDVGSKMIDTARSWPEFAPYIRR